MNTELLLKLIPLLQSDTSAIEAEHKSDEPVSRGPGAVMIGKPVILRCLKSGVYFGELVWCDADQARLKDARRIWSWSGALDTLDLAAKGPQKGFSGKVSAVVIEHGVCDVLDYILCSDAVGAKFRGLDAWSED